MYMLRYKFREAADLQGEGGNRSPREGGNRSPREGGGRRGQMPPHLNAALNTVWVCMWALLTYHYKGYFILDNFTLIRFNCAVKTQTQISDTLRAHFMSNKQCVRF